MQHRFTIDLEITLEDSGSRLREVLNLYAADFITDLDQTAWNLCACDDRLQQDQFASPVLERWEVTRQRGDRYSVQARFNVIALSPSFAGRVVEEYMDGLKDCLVVSLNGFYSRTGVRATLITSPLNWKAKVK